MRRSLAWLLEEGEISTDPLLGTTPPRLDVKVVDPLTEAENNALIAAGESYGTAATGPWCG